MSHSDAYDCACVILAAGGSRRLGSPKQLLRVNGETLIHRSVRLALQVGFSPVCVVLGSSAEPVRAELDDCNVLFAENDAWEDGMSTSLRAGISSLAGQQADIHHLLIMVCDQALLSQDILARLRDASTANREHVIASVYAGRKGVPAIFPHSYFHILSNIEGDRGAQQVIEKAQMQVITVDFPEGAVDIDTLEDVSRLGLS